MHNKILLENSEQKRQLGRHRHRQDDNIKVDLKEIYDVKMWELHYCLGPTE
jgi:hypothetical protein